MIEKFTLILNQYQNCDRLINSKTPVYQTLCHDLPREIEVWLNRSDLKVKGSMGQGTKTFYPWITIISKNEQVARSTRNGLYIAILFKRNLSGFYLTIMQGITQFNQSKAYKKYEFVRIVAEHFRHLIAFDGFEDVPIDLLSKTNDRGYGYEQATICAKYYSKAALSEDSFKLDLLHIAKKYDELINSLEKGNYWSTVEKISNLTRQKLLIEISPPPPKLKNKIISPPAPRKVDYLEAAARKKTIGERGEDLVLEFEKRRLQLEDLDAENLLHVSVQDDSLGYDIQSVYKDQNGVLQKIFIEVKSTTGSVNSSFEITQNEIEQSKILGSNYYLYRVCDLDSDQPKFFKIQGPLADKLDLKPLVYQASPK